MLESRVILNPKETSSLWHTWAVTIVVPWYELTVSGLDLCMLINWKSVFMSTSKIFQVGLDGRSLRISGCVWELGIDDRHGNQPAEKMGKMILSVHLDTFGLSKIGGWIWFDDCLLWDWKWRLRGSCKQLEPLNCQVEARYCWHCRFLWCLVESRALLGNDSKGAIQKWQYPGPFQPPGESSEVGPTVGPLHVSSWTSSCWDPWWQVPFWGWDWNGEMPKLLDSYFSLVSPQKAR